MCDVLRSFKYLITLNLIFSELTDWETYGANESTPFNPLHKAVRRDLGGPIPPAQPGQMASKQYAGVQFAREGKAGLALREIATTSKKYKRTTILFVSRPHYCDYMARPCIHAYDTGLICARTVYYEYQTFDSYCLMEYVNCRENYEMWQMVYVGGCFDAPGFNDYMHYVYHDDMFLDNYYVVDDKIN